MSGCGGAARSEWSPARLVWLRQAGWGVRATIRMTAPPVMWNGPPAVLRRHNEGMPCVSLAVKR